MVGLHPASDGQLERDVLARYGAHAAVRLVRTTANPVAPEEVSTEALVGGSDVVAT